VSKNRKQKNYEEREREKEREREGGREGGRGKEKMEKDKETRIRRTTLASTMIAEATEIETRSTLAKMFGKLIRIILLFKFVSRSLRIRSKREFCLVEKHLAV